MATASLSQRITTAWKSWLSCPPTSSMTSTVRRRSIPRRAPRARMSRMITPIRSMRINSAWTALPGPAIFSTAVSGISWLVGGLGAGGSAIYALDITNPGTPTQASSFTQGNASSLVIGEWSSSLVYTTALNPATGLYANTLTSGAATFTCANVATCGQSLGKTYGTPQIRRFHNDPTPHGRKCHLMGSRIRQRFRQLQRRCRHLRHAGEQHAGHAAHVLLYEHRRGVEMSATRPPMEFTMSPPLTWTAITSRTTSTRATCWAMSGAST